MFNEPESDFDFCGAIHPDPSRGLICSLPYGHKKAHEAEEAGSVTRWDWTAFWEEAVQFPYSQLADG